MIKRRITREQVDFITNTVFDIARLILGDDSQDLNDSEVNSMVINVTMSKGDITGMFLNGQQYLMTVDKKSLIYIN